MPDIGSSPLSQGTFVHILHLIVPLRLIPATAENTKRHRTHASSLRLIPARTGSIRVTRQTEAPTPAHPRSRGDYTQFEITRWSCKGSSPLARGTTSKGRRFAGLPEAHPHSRGSTRTRTRRLRPWRAHPRLCGEHAFFATESPAGRGSSPLTRGTHRGERRTPGNRGLIPAHARNTRKTAYLSFFSLTSTPCGRGVPLLFQPHARDFGGFSSRQFIQRRTSDSK